LAGIPVGLLVRRWSVLLIPVALWVILGVAWGVAPAISRGRGFSVGAMILWTLYYFVPPALTLGVGVAIGRLVARRRPSAQ
jgi:hypothetical protein